MCGGRVGDMEGVGEMKGAGDNASVGNCECVELRGVAGEAWLPCPPPTCCCAVWFLKGHGLVSVHDLGVEK